MISNVLTETMVQTNASPKNWEEAIRMAGQLLLDEKKVKPEFINSMIETVNTYGPYMILVPKVCFFHGTPGSDVIEPCLSLCVFKDPVFFEEYENKQINCCFAFGATDKDSHMEMLKNVVQLLQDQEFIQLITNNGSKSMIMECIQKY
ncbi:MAG: PTS sugar transporter subunit IIA [Solobacterium sp.]|jgi:PTS system ascorbate-specific IIA component|nr:PTS sugar transporter subunit IIA [Solobacterium sp.]MCH4266007.1 PTS sugar transporter subunit IIA [Solobacterium sp.]